ncbi:STAS domain-containing protein [Methylocystis parvus]|uniref:Anti-sigma factor antagonist n=1 Tax=Methylocystis parvus TaxID=134 RepID=A0A6B8LWP0_9HYPH|nr:STAS domain-containing protein [Methylocystis parvus]QGM96787.1 STAS domain-containing protein [Methylocystis parvus]WBJ99337.1 STAS domain-containing protein [Methylocystis parvus OBBP]
MNLSTIKQNGKMVISVKEPRVDAHNSAELKDRILKILEGGERNLVVDLEEVEFIDSSGLGALLSGYKNANLRSSGFALSGLRPRVRSMFELTRLHRVFDIYPKLQEATSS